MIGQILIVEDDPRTRKTIRHFCQEVPGAKNAHVTEAANGLEAREILKNEHPDVMFLDMEMPGMGGKELLTFLMEEDRHVRTVIVSGYDDFEHTRKAIQYGTVDYLLKPVSRKHVCEILTRLSEEQAGSARPQMAETEATGIGAIKNYIDAFYTEPLTLGLLSEKFHYSREYISRKFKKEYGVGLIHYLNDLRLERARVLLAQGFSSQKTCEKVGFTDNSYFARLFKEKYGKTPQKYLK